MSSPDLEATRKLIDHADDVLVSALRVRMELGWLAQRGKVYNRLPAIDHKDTGRESRIVARMISRGCPPGVARAVWEAIFVEVRGE